MRSKRHEEIIKIITNTEVETQEELASLLRDSGYNVTQATVSRDIKNLKLTKVLDKSGKYKYAQMITNTDNVTKKMNQILHNTLINVEKVDKFVVVKTLSGSGNAACEAIDTLDFADIAGTIAGDNTIFILCRTEEGTNELIEIISEYIEN